MRKGMVSPAAQLLSILLMAAVTPAMWAAWLGWDQQYDVQPDGTSTGPYQPWQVIGLALSLLVPVCWAAYRRYFAGAVLGTTAGLTVAAYYDWSDDASGLFAIGVGLVMMGSLVATTAVFAVVAALLREHSPQGGRL
ncbi:hypothetical protein ACLGIH_18220 [Streptomyces sp. HMX87]|uniref:hypothetical protein n=1 Tax=Streptomyces sp. HMX87 TaxID=3390849 RepID=UPI003A83D7EC